RVTPLGRACCRAPTTAAALRGARWKPSAIVPTTTAETAQKGKRRTHEGLEYQHWYERGRKRRGHHCRGDLLRHFGRRRQHAPRPPARSLLRRHPYRVEMGVLRRQPGA